MDYQRGFQHGEHQGECKAELALKVIQGRWKVLILRELVDGIQRFSDLQRAIEGVSQKVLTSQLRDLEADGVVHRTIHPEVPPRVDYYRKLKFSCDLQNKESVAYLWFYLKCSIP